MGDLSKPNSSFEFAARLIDARRVRIGATRPVT
jgi:hypothetical protein